MEESPKSAAIKQTESEKQLSKDSGLMQGKKDKATAETPAFGIAKDKGFFKDFPTPSQFGI